MNAVVIDAAPPTPVPWLLVAAILIGSAVVSWGFVEAVKKTALNNLKQRMTAAEARKALWWTPLLVLVSMAMGFSVGSAVGGLEWSWGYGGLVGACGGALASFIVGLVKSRLRALADKTDA